MCNRSASEMQASFIHIDEILSKAASTLFTRSCAGHHHVTQCLGLQSGKDRNASLSSERLILEPFAVQRDFATSFTLAAGDLFHVHRKIDRAHNAVAEHLVCQLT